MKHDPSIQSKIRLPGAENQLYEKLEILNELLRTNVLEDVMDFKNKIREIKNSKKIKKKYFSNTREKNTWVLGEWFGRRCCDNCFYFANYLAKNYPEIDLYWAAYKGTDTSGLEPRIKMIEIGTEEALAVYRRAGVAVMAQGFIDFSDANYNYFGGGISVNLWHGVPWKHIGHDGSKSHGKLFRIYTSIVDKYAGADKYLATSDVYAKICETAFGAGRDQVIKAGYPRNNIFYSEATKVKCREKILKKLELETGQIWDMDTKFITYMPTFRDKTENSFSFEALSADTKFLDWLEANRAVILQKAHFVTAQRNNGINGKKAERIISFNDVTVTAQELLAATDLLVTDYSGCCFDFLVLDRPIVHFLYDYEYYANQDRGLYFPQEDIACGDVAWKAEELPCLIAENLRAPGKNADLRTRRKQQYMKYENENACEQIIGQIRSWQEKQ